LGEAMVAAQLAVTPPEQRRGLMHRPSLPADSGMLFVYAEPQAMSFWMMNTEIDLDIGFFSPSGKLMEIHTMFAGDTQTTRSRSDQLQYALEMNRGWFAQRGIRPGAQLSLDDLRAALRARGFDPDSYVEDSASD
jgi:uncharacterized membrane protein (UPF0127 family)